MKLLSPKVHGYLEYLVVVAFLAAPTVLGFTGLPAQLAYAIGVVHLVVTLLTAFPLGAVKLIPFPVHGVLELIVAVVLLALPWLAGFTAQRPAQLFFVVAGAIIGLVFLTTDYKAAARG